MKRIKRVHILMVILVAVSAFALGHWWLLDKNYVTYQIDSANECSWNGTAMGAMTDVGNLGPLPTVKMKKSQEIGFMIEAASKHKCVYRVN